MTAAKKMDSNLSLENIINSKFFNPKTLNDIQVVSAQPPSEVLRMALEKSNNHIIQSDGAHFENEVQASALMLNDIDTFVKNPVDSILNPEKQLNEKLEMFRSDFCRASEKHDLLSKIEAVLQAKKVSTSLRSDLLVVSDELVTNAIFNAPFVDRDNTLPGASRHNPDVEMIDGKKAQIFAGASFERIVIGVCDPFGTLNIRKLLNRIKGCYDNSVAASMNMSDKGGAGIGSYMVFNSSSSYYALVDENNFTMICSVVPLKMSSRVRQELPKNLHWYRKQKG